MKKALSRLWYNYGGVPVLTIAILIPSIVMAVCVWYSVAGVHGWIQAMPDATERGLAYVACAICVHALFGRTSITVNKKGDNQ